MTNGTPWWVAIVVGVLTAAAALGGTVIASWRQNRRAGREEWFRRVQWAQGLTAGDDDGTRAAGYRVLHQLSHSPLATDDDRQLLLELTRAPALLAAQAGYGEDVKVSRATIEAARAQLAISKQLGLPVSGVVEKIAAVR